MPRLPRPIVAGGLPDSDWRVRLAALRAFGLCGGGMSYGDSGCVMKQHGDAIAQLLAVLAAG